MPQQRKMPGRKTGNYCYFRSCRVMPSFREDIFRPEFARRKRTRVLQRHRSWDDIYRSDWRDRSWKSNRATQYKPIPMEATT